MTASINQTRTRFWAFAMAAALTASFVAQTATQAAAGFASLDFGGRVESVLMDLANSKPADAVRVIVGKNNPADTSIESYIHSTGGKVERDLPIVDGFSATVPAGTVPALGANSNLRSMSLNRIGKFETITYDESTVASNPPKTSGAAKLWPATDYGSGVGVAVIDTGISPMNDFTARGYRLVHGPDLSGEFSMIDSYGHGTVMGGLIAGDGYDSAGAHVGSAPKAWLVSVKVAGRNGAADVSTVLAAMHWVAAYRNNYNIRVMNLSWGTQGTQSYKYDPLNYAVERLWQLGITPVVAAGNSGPNAGTITKPADDPFVITVGAYNANGNLDPADDSVPGWSSRGPTTADGLTKPDVVASGRMLIASRSYGSTIEQTYPKALYAPSYIRGSGTSQAAAVTSGAVALLIKSKPYLSPAQVKHLLMSTAAPIAGATANQQGAGRIDVSAAAASTSLAYANSTTEPANGLGSIELARGGAHIQTDCNGDGVQEVIQGEITARCEPWNPTAWTGGSWNGDAWTGGSWNGGSWNGGSWNGGSWNGASWNGGSWNGGSWNGTSWTGGSWNGGSWNNAEFNGGSWNGGSWNGGSWNGGSWNGGSWNGGSWNGGSWNGGSWNGGSWNGGSWNGGSWNTSAWTTGTYDEFTSAEYDEFLTAFWGPRPPANRKLTGEVSESLLTKFDRS